MDEVLYYIYISLQHSIQVSVLQVHKLVQIATIHRWWKGCGYRAAVPHDFKVLHRILIFCR